MVDSNLKKIVTYSKNNMLFLPHCIKIRTLRIINDDDKCYKNIQVSYNVSGNDNKSYIGFLSKNKIIVKKGMEIACHESNDFHFFLESNKLLVYEGKIKNKYNRVTLIDATNKVEINLFKNNFIVSDFPHLTNILDEVDTFSEIETFNNVDHIEEQKSENITDSTIGKSENVLELGLNNINNKVEKVKTFILNSKTLVHTVLIIITVSVTVLCLTYLVYKIVMMRRYDQTRTSFINRLRANREIVRMSDLLMDE